MRHQGSLQKLFLEALEFRTTRGNEVARSEFQKIERCTCVALVRLALKLPEASLRPLIYKIFTWATLEGSPTTRLFSLYTLYVSLAEALKSMFPLFTGTLGQHFIDILVSFSYYYTLLVVYILFVDEIIKNSNRVIRYPFLSPKSITHGIHFLMMRRIKGNC